MHLTGAEVNDMRNRQVRASLVIVMMAVAILIGAHAYGNRSAAPQPQADLGTDVTILVPAGTAGALPPSGSTGSVTPVDPGTAGTAPPEPGGVSTPPASAVSGLVPPASGSTPPAPPTPGSAQEGDDILVRLTQRDLPEAVASWVEARHGETGVHFMTYDRLTYILVALGERPTGGYAVTITKVARLDDQRARIYVDVRSPGPGDMVTQVITYPYDIGAVDAAYTQFDIKAPGLDNTFASSTGPNIVVTAPANGAVLGSTVRVTGRARATEGVLYLRLTDANGGVLAEQVLTLPAGAPDWSTFDQTISFARPQISRGFLWVYTLSPRDGTLLDAAVVPVKFGP